MIQTSRCHQFGQRLDRVVVKVINPLRFIGDHERSLADWILSRDTSRTRACVAMLSLNTSDRKHETACCVTPVGAQRHCPSDIKRRNHSPGGANPNTSPQIKAQQRVVHQAESISHGHPDVVHEFDGCCTRAAFLTIDHDEIWRNSSFLHGLGDREPFPGVPNRQLESGRFVTRKFTQSGDEFQ